MGEGGGGEEKGSFSPSALSLFRLHLSPFPPETPDTQATQTLVHALEWDELIIAIAFSSVYLQCL